eukprot:scaffold88358_cov71-Phaeocystis_antarctica.AAC.10
MGSARKSTARAPRSVEGALRRWHHAMGRVPKRRAIGVNSINISRGWKEPSPMHPVGRPSSKTLSDKNENTPSTERTSCGKVTAKTDCTLVAS